MAILKAKPDASSEADHTLNRVFPVTTKLTKEERGGSLSLPGRRGLHAGNGYAM